LQQEIKKKILEKVMENNTVNQLGKILGLEQNPKSKHKKQEID